jgi:serine/threonine protein kinase
MKNSTYGGGPRVAWKPPEIEQLTAAFPHLEIQQLLGVGGMGAVFKVRQKELDRIAALKVLPGEMAADAGFTERFLREARLLASLSHPHLVTVYEFGQRDGIYFLLMEFIDGVTLRQALRAEPIKKLGSKETLAIVGQLCDALQFAHDEGVVHRDIKPENILIDKRGRVKIADVGLARLLGQSPTMPTLTRTHQLMGIPACMAPEQIEGLPGIDHRADIYSMGVVFYELLTGELPLGRFSPPSERAKTDVRLDEVVLRTLAREPDRRYQQASEVKTDVEALRGPAVALNPFALPARRRWIGRSLLSFFAGVLLTPILFAALYLSLEARHRSQTTKEYSEHERQLAVAYVDREIAEVQARQAAEASATKSSMSSSMGAQDAGGGTMMSGAGGDGMAGMGGMPGGMGMSMSPMSTNAQSAIVFEHSLPSSNAHLFNLTGEQRDAVNKILNETHERYLKEEALHSIVAVDANGVQTTEISAFPDQLRAIENEMWTKLDVPSGFAALHGEVSSYTETGGTASATLTIPNKPPVPVRFKCENGQWKIDAIGSNERLLERLKQTKIWKQHAEIEAVLENARTASVLVTLTEEAQSEWLGEMTVAMLRGGGLTHLQSRLPETFFDQEIHTTILAEYQKNRNLLTPDAQSDGLAGQSVEVSLGTTSVSAEVRRQAVIDLGKLCGDRGQLLQKLLEFRDEAGIRTKFNGSLSGLREISATSKEGLFTFGWDNPDTRTELPTPVKVVVLQIDGLWKLNTIIDPALKPWPLPAEEPTPPAEPVPVDGATGVP